MFRTIETDGFGFTFGMVQGFLRSWEDLGKLGASVGSQLRAGVALGCYVYTEFDYDLAGRHKSLPTWDVYADAMKDKGADLLGADVVLADSFALPLLLLAGYQGKVIALRPPVVGEERKQVAETYDRWIAKANGSEWEAFRGKLNAPGLYGGGGCCPQHPNFAARLFQGAAASNIALEDFSVPQNWVIWNRPGAVDRVFHTEGALQKWQAWGMPVFDSLEDSLAALGL